MPTLQDVPVFLRGGLRRALEFALTALRAAYAGPAEEAVRARAWKLFLLTPRMLLARTAETGAAGRRELLARVGAYERAEWPALLERARAQHRPARGASNIADAEAAAAHRREVACAKVRKGELSRARHDLTSAPLAPGDAATLAALTDVTKRPARPRQDIPDELLQFRPPAQVHISAAAIARSLRACKRGRQRAGLVGSAGRTLQSPARSGRCSGTAGRGCHPPRPC